MTVTPFVKRMRTQGGTIYTFSSALEDIGLNINERNNVVKMSNYALLNIPAIDVPPNNTNQNRFNVLAIPGAYESFLNSGSIKDGRVIIAESFQNYALNLETNLLAQDTYNPALSITVSERVFWKWLKETGAIRWMKYDTSAGTYFKEELDTDSSVGYNSIVKCIGQISAGSVRTDTFGTYNETYVLVPTSFGQTPVYFKQVEDDNYKHGMSIVNGNTNILGRETYLQPHPDGLDIQAYYDLSDSSTSVVGQSMFYDNSTGSYTTGWWWTAEGLPLTSDNNYYTDTNAYMSSGKYNMLLKYTGTSMVEFKRSSVDCLSIEYDIDKIRTIFNDSTATFDSLAIQYAEDDQFDFNAVLIYYSVYNKALDTVLATNLLGILFLDAPSGNTSGYPISEITIPSITKLQSGPSGFGTSYSFRLNVKSDYMLDDTAAIIVDNATSSQLVLDDFTKVFDSLSKTLAILNSQTGTLSYITEQYLDITQNQTNLINQINNIQNIVNDVTQDIQGTENVLAMFSSGSDPLVDSSVYMKNGNVGVKTDNPQYPFEVNGTTKAKSIIIENAIKDTSGHILLGYGSPLQLGSSTNYREIAMYTGNPNYGLRIDTSNNVYFEVSNASTGYTLYYNPTTKKITYGLAPSGSGSDSSIYAWSITYPSIGVPVNSGDVINFSDSSTVKIVGSKIGTQITLKFDASVTGGGTTSGIGGSGTATYIPKFINSSTLGDSALIDDGTTVKLVRSNPLFNIVGQSNQIETLNFVDNTTTTFSILSDNVDDSNHIKSEWPLYFSIASLLVDREPLLAITTDALRSNIPLFFDSSARIKAADSSGSGYPLNLLIEAGAHTGGRDGGSIGILAGDTSSNNRGGDILIASGINTKFPTNPAYKGYISIGRSTHGDNLAADVYLGGVNNIAGEQFVFIDPDTGRLTYHTDTSAGTFGGLDASLATTTVRVGTLETSVNIISASTNDLYARTATIDASIYHLDASKASIQDPQFAAGDLMIGDWRFRVDTSNNLSIQYGHTVIVRFLTDGSILVRGTAVPNQPVDENPKG